MACFTGNIPAVGAAGRRQARHCQRRCSRPRPKGARVADGDPARPCSGPVHRGLVATRVGGLHGQRGTCSGGAPKGPDGRDRPATGPGRRDTPSEDHTGRRSCPGGARPLSRHQGSATPRAGAPPTPGTSPSQSRPPRHGLAARGPGADAWPPAARVPSPIHPPIHRPASGRHPRVQDEPHHLHLADRSCIDGRKRASLPVVGGALVRPRADQLRQTDHLSSSRHNHAVADGEVGVVHRCSAVPAAERPRQPAHRRGAGGSGRYSPGPRRPTPWPAVGVIPELAPEFGAMTPRSGAGTGWARWCTACSGTTTRLRAHGALGRAR